MGVLQAQPGGQAEKGECAGSWICFGPGARRHSRQEQQHVLSCEVMLGRCAEGFRQLEGVLRVGRDWCSPPAALRRGRWGAQGEVSLVPDEVVGPGPGQRWAGTGPCTVTSKWRVQAPVTAEARNRRGAQAGETGGRQAAEEEGSRGECGGQRSDHWGSRAISGLN